MAPDRTYLISSSPSKPFKIYNLSSSPAPSLNENVTYSPNTTLKDAKALPSPRYTSAFSSFTATFSRSEDSIQVSVADLDQSFKRKVADRVGKNNVSVDKCTKTKRTPTKKSLKGRENIKKCAHEENSTKLCLEGEDNCISERDDERGSSEDGIILVEKPSKTIRAKSRNPQEVGAASNPKARKKVEDRDGSKPSSGRKKDGLKNDKSRQSQLLKGKVTKPYVSSILASKPVQFSDLSNDLFQNPCHESEVSAIKRRRAWTPPKENDSSSIQFPVIGSNYSVSPDNPSAPEENKEKLAGLLEEFVYTHITKSPSKKETKVKSISKRKLIEIVKTNTPTSGRAKKKEKAPSKKARTLTELSTSIYTEDENIQTKSPKKSSQPAVVEKSKTSISKTSGTPNSSNKPPKRKSKDNQTPKTSLLSPESALREVSKQDFVFGTSSQLAREDSPGFLKDLHEAMQASNQLKDPFFSSPVLSSIKKAKNPKQNLWNAASRSSDGSLLNDELVVITASPSTSEKTGSSLFLSKDPFIDIDDKPLAEVIANLDHPSSINSDGLSSLEEQKIKPFNFSPKCAHTEEKECSLNITKRKQRQSDNLASSTEPIEQRPNFESYTNAQLAKEISKYHFKPVKKRDEMISLLQQCWEGKQRMKLGSLETNTKIIPTIEPADGVKSKDRKVRSPTRTKKNTRKVSPRSLSPKLVTFHSEISDTESNSSMLLTSRSPKRSQKKSPYKSKTSPPSLSARSSSIELSPASSSRLLFSHITQAIKNTSPSKEAKNPNWNEKILLYDPIVLEDLTVWLNTGALQKTNWDGEVEPKVVKKWCDSRSICCLWRENLKGGARDRY
ncbi:Structure-specific endonuclease subunit slx4 [Golovinomyces cichoracearum]|uniref:Structure-specific endonuclease subunit SLX4 n=1 Tax=Golovinomyces cichoracearum TaxID=62708 RepID=A0A420IG16_9PEZI|nr:Structure-specific endonuclease subunit slx4 [Golovinomyces cichoracearum]